MFDSRLHPQRWLTGLLGLFVLLSPPALQATPANKAALARHYDRFLSKSLNNCTTCHLPSDRKNPETLAEFPHNVFGNRLRELAPVRPTESESGAPADFESRLATIAEEDTDGDGAANEVELLLGHAPGDAKDTPTAQELSSLASRRKEFSAFLTSYRWRPFEPVRRPALPEVDNRRWARNPIDRFIAAEHTQRGLKPLTEASKPVLLRRLYIDLIGLVPTPAEIEAFVRDRSPDAYDKVVERLLADPRHGERWARHWMDIWRYSDWAGWADGGQIRDSQPHIWRWRDWIVESLNADKGYDQMLLEMLAADEIAPDDTNTLRATGFLVRNYKMLSREQWLEDTIKHTSQAFLGLTVGCAKCHDHMTDPISQREYYQMRAVFEPHWVRTDRVPGQTNTTLDGLVRVYDTDTNPPTYLFHRGDERRPDTNQLLTAKLPRLFKTSLDVQPVSLTRNASLPDKRPFVARDSVEAGDKAITQARAALEKTRTNTTLTAIKKLEAEMAVEIAVARKDSLVATLAVEELEDEGRKSTDEWDAAARKASTAQRQVALLDARLKLEQARHAQAEAKSKAEEAQKALDATPKDSEDKQKAAKKASEKTTKEHEAAQKKFTEAEQAFAKAEKDSQAEPSTKFQPRALAKFPSKSTGRRLAFARWMTERDNPLVARVAANYVWSRHFGQSLIPTPTDYGSGGKPPTHPALLDWLAMELMEGQRSEESAPWSLKHLHRLIVTSSTYRMASASDEANADQDPDNTWYWRMNSRRMEAEIVRDNLLYVAGNLDLAMGGADIDHKLALTSKRRSLYLRCAQEKQPEFLKIFDGPSVVECYERKPTVMPQQALALANSELAWAQAKSLAKTLNAEARSDEDFIRRAYWRVLGRRPKAEEMTLCREFLQPGVKSVKVEKLNAIPKTRENLMLIMFNHSDFVTVR